MIFIPGELSVDISFPVTYGVLWHARAFHLVCIKRVQFALVWQQNLVTIAEIFIKILLVVLGIV